MARRYIPVKLSTVEKPVFYTKLKEDSAAKADELLDDNHRNCHIFFNNEGFHNHIVHHIFSLYALGATPVSLESHYARNRAYQRAPFPVEERVVEDMSDPERFMMFLGNEKYYHDFVVFFEGEMEKKGWREVIQQYVLDQNERSQAMMVRVFAGFLHPLIHLGYGVEFEQPAIVAEALAQAAVHTGWIGDYLLPAEEAAGKNPSRSPLLQLLEETHANQRIRESAQWGDPNKIRDGILKRAADEMISVASRYQVDDLEQRTAEMINISAYFTGAAQHPPHVPKIDFFYMHSLNSSIFYSAFLRADWIDDADKRRLLEWKGRLDLALYASRGNPPLDIRAISEYPLREGSEEEQWKAIFEAARRFEDDGHFSKLIRAIANGKQVCEKYGDRKDLPVQNRMWLQLAQLATDSVAVEGPTWVRGAGFNEAWEQIPRREASQL